eukprot:TRINITY_DN1790_c0_g1_i3.p1 TRINITY_DN1790_c0_g1~~TRINITY_DN1790_c0_g1_i3.p1  ORF type:complete len:237 (+),score=36.34 TRINITY_DN1790_c0_g1_i3:184-894(+)
MQDVAQEMNLAETAFLVRENDGYNLRWFTPTAEVDLCGHATLAASHVLWETGALDISKPAKFYTRSGLLTSVKTKDWIQMDFPREEAVPLTDTPVNILEGFNLKAEDVIYCGKNRFDLLIVVANEERVLSLKPNFLKLMDLPRGVMVTSVADPNKGYHFVSRFFAPAVGVNEDPVTGSAHCCLCPYWSKIFNKTELIGYQASKRGGQVKVILNDKRVLLLGQALTTIRGKIQLPNY